MSIRFIQSRADQGHAPWEVEVPIGGKRVREYKYTEGEAKESERSLSAKTFVITECQIDLAITEYHANVAKKNVGHKNERLIFNRAILFFVKRLKLRRVDQIRYRHLEKLTEHLREKEKLSNATINRHFACYKAFFKWAMKMEYTEKNPCELVSLEPVSDVTRAGGTEEQFKLVHGKCPEFFKRVAECLYFTALRPVTVSGLCWADIHEEYFEYTVLKGYGGKAVRRKFPMIPQLKALFQAQADYLKSVGILPAGKNLVFLNSKFKRLTASRISKIGNKAIKRAGLTGLELYDFRYALAQDLQAAGVDLEKIRALMGHAGVRMTRHYAGPIEMGSLSKAVESVRSTTASSDFAARMPHGKEGLNLL